MSEYDNNMSGALFRAEKKTEKHPDYTGSCEINNEEYWVSSWIRESKNGKKYMSLSFTAKEQPKKESFNPTQDFDEDIPF